MTLLPPKQRSLMFGIDFAKLEKSVAASLMELRCSRPFTYPGKVFKMFDEPPSTFGDSIVNSTHYLEEQKRKNERARQMLDLTGLTLPYFQQRMYDHMADSMAYATGIRSYPMGQLNPTFHFDGKIFRCTNEFRKPQEGEYWLTPVNMEVYGPHGGHNDDCNVRNVPKVGYSRVIVELVQASLLTVDVLMEVMTGHKTVTLACHVAPCNGEIANIYAAKHDQVVNFYHTGNDCSIGRYNLTNGHFEWLGGFLPVNVIVKNISDTGKVRVVNEEEEAEDFPY